MAEPYEPVRPCMWCGREQTDNPAHDINDPDTGYAYVCIPCLVRQRNVAQRVIHKIEAATASYRDQRNDVFVRCGVCGGAPESTLHLGLGTPPGHRYEPAGNDQGRQSS